MALTRTLSDLRTEALERADVRAIQVPTVTLDRMLNASLKRLYRLLVAANRDFYVTGPTTVTITSGLGTLPTDFWLVLGVEADAGGGDYRKLPRFNFAERNRCQSTLQIWECGYRVAGASLRIFPPSSGSVRLWYVPAPTALVNASDTWDGYAGFEDWAIVDTAIRIRTKFEEDVAALLAERDELTEEIRMSASDRDSSEPNRIRDMDLEDGGETWEGCDA